MQHPNCKLKAPISEKRSIGDHLSDRKPAAHIEFREMIYKSKHRLLNHVLAAVLLLVVLPSFKQSRALLAWPLYIHHPDASAELAYVMSGGPASFERLLAASDLYHTEKISEIAIENESHTSSYNYLTNQSESRSDRCVEYLVMRGVPRDRVRLIPPRSSSRFGSLREAQNVAQAINHLDQLIVITSPAHTRRSELAFKRSLPNTVDVRVYAASDLTGSDEIFSPLWIEYIKLAVYIIIA